MSVSNEVKQQYVKAINAIWNGTMQFNEAAYMSNDVMALMDSILSEIKDKSKPMFIVDLTVQILSVRLIYASSFVSWKQTLELLVDAGKENIDTWINIVKGNTRYKAVVNATALSFKSPLQMALYDTAFGF